MNKFLLATILVFVKFIFEAIFGFQWQVFDPLLVVVVVFTFFHSFDTLDYLGYAIFCGLLKDIFSSDIFGIYTLTYLAATFIVVAISRLLYRHNWFFVFPVVFIAVFLTYPTVFILKATVLKSTTGPYSAFLFLRSLVESFASVVWAYPIYIFSKRCACELIA
jgi:rod shape-determining protein MreD